MLILIDAQADVPPPACETHEAPVPLVCRPDKNGSFVLIDGLTFPPKAEEEVAVESSDEQPTARLDEDCKGDELLEAPLPAVEDGALQSNDPIVRMLCSLMSPC